MHTATAQASPNIAFGCERSPMASFGKEIRGDPRISLTKNALAFLAITIAYKFS
jgi:hypothetical protein